MSNNTKLLVWYRAEHPVESADAVDVCGHEPQGTDWNMVHVPEGDASDIDLAVWAAVWHDYTEAYLIGHAIYCYMAIMAHLGIEPSMDFDASEWFEPGALDPTGNDGPDAASLMYLRKAVNALSAAISEAA